MKKTLINSGTVLLTAIIGLFGTNEIVNGNFSFTNSNSANTMSSAQSNNNVSINLQEAINEGSKSEMQIAKDELAALRIKQEMATDEYIRNLYSKINSIDVSLNGFYDEKTANKIRLKSAYFYELYSFVKAKGIYDEHKVYLDAVGPKRYNE